MKYDLILISFFFKEFISWQGNTKILIKKQTFHCLMVDQKSFEICNLDRSCSMVVFCMCWYKKTNYQGIIWLRIKLIQLMLRDCKYTSFYSDVVLTLEYEMGCFSLFMQIRFNCAIALLCILTSGFMPGRNFWSKSTSYRSVWDQRQRARMNVKIITLENILFSCQEDFQRIGLQCVSWT